MKTIKKMMLVSLSFTIMMMISCGGGSQKEAEIQKIKELEKKYYADKNAVTDKKKTTDLINAYKEFSKKFPKDTASATCLFKAAQLSSNMMLPKQAIELYDQILKDFTDYTKAPDCLFLKAFIYETQLRDLPKAQQFYEEFITKYPKHDLTDDAQISIQNLNKTPEELIKEFEAKAKKDSIKTNS